MRGSFFFLSNLDDSNNMQPELLGPRWVVTKVFPLSLRLFPVIKEERRDGRSTDLQIKTKRLPSQEFPSGFSIFWLLAYSCGHSAGFKPASLLDAIIAAPSTLFYIFLCGRGQVK